MELCYVTERNIQMICVYNSQLEKFLADLQTRSNIQLYRCDYKSLQSAQQRYPGRVGKAKPAWKYYFVEYRCVFGGRRHKSKSTGD